MEGTKYYTARFRLHQQDGYLLWVEKPEGEYLWANEKQMVPACKSQYKAEELAKKQGFKIEVSQPPLLNLDKVKSWLNKPEKMPPPDSLGAWSMFDDLSCGLTSALPAIRKDRFVIGFLTCYI